MPFHIRALPAQRVAFLRYSGPFDGDGIARSWQRFAAWFLSRGLMQPPRERYGITLDDPRNPPGRSGRYDCCIAVGEDFQPEGEIGVRTLAAGTWACAEFEGRAEEFEAAWARFHGEWLPASAWRPEDRAPMERYPADAVPDSATGRIRCELCIPVRPR